MDANGTSGLLAVEAYLRGRAKPCTNMRKLARIFVHIAGPLPGYTFAFVPRHDGKVGLQIIQLAAAQAVDFEAVVSPVE